MNNPENKTVFFKNYVYTYQKEVQSSINFIGQDVDFFIGLKADLIVNIARRYIGNIETANVLDIGSGIGLTDHHLTPYFKNLHGVDIEEEVVETARRFNKDVNYSFYNGLELPFEDNSIDLAFSINVMHHVPPVKWENFLKEIYRVLKPGGIGAIFEHNPLNPLTRLAVSKCEFDRDAVLIHKKKLRKMFSRSGFAIAAQSFIVFFPFRSRIFRAIEKTLGWLPLGAQYFLIGKKSGILNSPVTGLK